MDKTKLIVIAIVVVVLTFDFIVIQTANNEIKEIQQSIDSLRTLIQRDTCD